MERFKPKETERDKKLKNTYTAKTFEDAVQTVQYIWEEMNRKKMYNTPAPSLEDIQQYFTQNPGDQYKLGNINLSFKKHTKPTDDNSEKIEFIIYVQCADDGGDDKTNQAIDEIIRSIDIKKGNIQYWKDQLSGSDLELNEYNDVIIESRPPHDGSGYNLLATDVETNEGVVDVYGSSRVSRLFIHKK